MKALTLAENARARRLFHQPDAVTAEARCYALKAYKAAIERLEQCVLLHAQRGDEEGWAIALVSLNAAVDAFDREFAPPEDDDR